MYVWFSEDLPTHQDNQVMCQYKTIKYLIRKYANVTITGSQEVQPLQASSLQGQCAIDSDILGWCLDYSDTTWIASVRSRLIYKITCIQELLFPEDFNKHSSSWAMWAYGLKSLTVQPSLKKCNWPTRNKSFSFSYDKDNTSALHYSFYSNIKAS